MRFLCAFRHETCPANAIKADLCRTEKPFPIPGWGRAFDHHETVMKSILALAGSLCLLLALHAGLFVMLALTHLLQNAAAGALALEPLQSALQRFVLTKTYLGHCYPSSRSSRLDISQTDRRMANRIAIITLFALAVNGQS